MVYVKFKYSYVVYNIVFDIILKWSCFYYCGNMWFGKVYI